MDDIKIPDIKVEYPAEVLKIMESSLISAHKVFNRLYSDLIATALTANQEYMNKYELYMQRGADCYIRACHTEDVDLRLFWYHAAHEFEKRARNLKLSEVTK